MSAFIRYKIFIIKLPLEKKKKKSLTFGTQGSVTKIGKLPTKANAVIFFYASSLFENFLTCLDRATVFKYLFMLIFGPFTVCYCLKPVNLSVSHLIAQL